MTKAAKATAASMPTVETTETGQADTAVWVCEQLDQAYGKLMWRSHGEPLSSLVMTILSQATSDTNSERAFDNLRRTFPAWKQVRTAPTSEVADAIRSGGLADAKAPRIKTVLGEIHERTGRDDLEFLHEMPTDAAKAYLLGFHGVGPKTAACVLMFSLGRPVLPVDTHVFRVSHRIGLIEKRIGEAKAHGALEAQLPPERIYAFHVHMIRHGRRICTAQKPRCGECVLSSRCDYFQSGAAGAGTAASDTAKRNLPTTLHGLPAPQTETDTVTRAM